MTACRQGTYNPNKRSTKPDDCILCPAGSYCKGVGLGWPSGLCARGFFCPDNSTQSDPPDSRCPANFFCPEGSPFPRPCLDGQESGPEAEKCSTCNAGVWCHNGTKESCPVGHWCPSGTLLPHPCPPGRFRSKKGGAKAQDCELCAEGKYCQGFGKLWPKNVFCPSGSLTFTLQLSQTHRAIFLLEAGPRREQHSLFIM